MAWLRFILQCNSWDDIVVHNMCLYRPMIFQESLAFNINISQSQQWDSFTLTVCLQYSSNSNRTITLISMKLLGDNYYIAAMAPWDDVP